MRFCFHAEVKNTAILMTKDQQLRLLILVEGDNEDIGRKATVNKIYPEEGRIFHLSNGETPKVEEYLYFLKSLL